MSNRLRFNVYKPALTRGAAGANQVASLLLEFAFDADLENISNEEVTRNQLAGLTHTARIRTRYFPQLGNVKEGWVLEWRSMGTRYFVNSSLTDDRQQFTELLVRQLTK